jgi:hypothetical protein
MMLSAPSNGLGPSRPVHRAPIQTLRGLSAPGEIPVVRPPTVRVDVTSRGGTTYRLADGVDDGFSYTPRAGSSKPGLPDAVDPQAALPRVRFSAETIEAMGPRPAGMKNAHRHHILEVNGRAGEHRTLVREGQDILRSYNIDPLQGPENLVWAPNKGHTATAARNLVEELRTLKQVGADRDLIVDTLRRHGQQAARR